MCQVIEQLAGVLPEIAFLDFKNHGGQRKGRYEKTLGTQWSCYRDLGSKRFYLLVNLEGVKDQDQGWPIARFLERELRNPKLHNLLETLPSVDLVQLILMRDTWRSRRFREADDDFLAGTPIPLNHVTPEGWGKTCSEGLNCLSLEKNGWSRGKHIVPHSRAEREVSPHLQFRLPLTFPPKSSDLNSSEQFEVLRLAMSKGLKTLRPLYDFVADRSAA